MNSFRKVGDTWAIKCDEEHQPGEIVTVSLKSGATKAVTLGALIYARGTDFVYEAAPAKRPDAVTVGDLTGVLALFANAKKRLKHPAVVLSVPAADMTIRLSLAGPRAKVPGSITVLDANKQFDGERDWFGRITTDGAFQPSNKLNGRTDAVAARLREFASDPARVAAEHGKLTGNCCFCNLPLGQGDDKRSIEVGYGPVCAKNFSLPWGTKAATGSDYDGALDEADRRTIRPQDYR